MRLYFNALLHFFFLHIFIFNLFFFLSISLSLSRLSTFIIILMHLLLSVGHCSEYYVDMCVCVIFPLQHVRAQHVGKSRDDAFTSFEKWNAIFFCSFKPLKKSVCCTSNAPTIEIERKFGIKATASTAVIL